MATRANQEKMSVKDNLFVRGPAQAALPVGPGDPPVAQLIQVDVDHIDLCELNPRRAPNTLFQRLYESILVNGLDNPIHAGTSAGCAGPWKCSTRPCPSPSSAGSAPGKSTSWAGCKAPTKTSVWTGWAR